MTCQESGFRRAHRAQGRQPRLDSGGKPGEPQKDSYFKSDTKLKPPYTGLKQNKKREKGGRPPSRDRSELQFWQNVRQKTLGFMGRGDSLKAGSGLADRSNS